MTRLGNISKEKDLRPTCFFLVEPAHVTVRTDPDWRHGSAPERRGLGGPLGILRTAEGGKSGIAMSTIEEVKAAEKKVQKVLDVLKKADAQDPNHLSAELKNATDEYARVVRELK